MSTKGRDLDGAASLQSSDFSDPLLLRLIEGAENIGLFTLDLSGRVIRWNPGAERLFGYHVDEVIGNHFRHLFTVEDRHAGVPEQELNAADKEERTASKRWYVRQDGGSFWGSGVLVALKDGASTGYGCIIHDLTAQKLEEDEQNKSEVSL